MFAIREGLPDDLNACAALRAVYTTQSAWRLSREDPSVRQISESAPRAAQPALPPTLTFQMQQIRLPRPRTLTLPTAVVPLSETWERATLRLVALRDEQVCGYLLVLPWLEQQQGWLARLLVDSPLRGRGAGSALLRGCRTWAGRQGWSALVAHAPARNVRGIGFYQRRGFQISGLVEHFYPTREDALLLARAL
jgi:ribosomal protein S18 acetylase RimI-like enzyme